MCEVESYVARTRLARSDDGFKLLEQWPRRSFGLNEPAHVVFHVELGELQALPLPLWKPSERRNGVRMELQDIPKGQVVVVDHLAGLIAAVLAVPSVNHWEQGLHLHYVMDRGERKHGQGPLFIVHLGQCSWRLGQQACRKEDLLEESPLDLLQEGAPLTDLIRATPGLLRGSRERAPVAANAEGEGLCAVYVKAHEPIHSKEGPNSPLVLVICRPPARRASLVVACNHVKRKLWEGCRAILEKLGATVVLVTDAPRGVPCPRPVGLLPPHHLLEHATRGQLSHRRYTQWSWERQPSLWVWPELRWSLRLHGLGETAEVSAQELLFGLPGEVCHHHVATFITGERKVMPFWQSEQRACVETTARDLVDAVDGLQPWVGT
mmetsp:Transcript_108112/g.338161  ORF Transcript_108112/g.338161 Transcript_108112/m.338161 type:complete len:379 (-) Transcript_108112:1510-2646(-)